MSNNNQEKSALVLEPSTINVDITAPAAILAYTLLYLQTNDLDAASRLKIPGTLLLFYFIEFKEFYFIQFKYYLFYFIFILFLFYF